MKILFITLEQSARENLKSILDNNYFIKNNKSIFTYGMSNEKLKFIDLTNTKIKSMMGLSKIIFNLKYLYSLRKNLNNVIKNNNFSHIFFIDSFDFTKFFLNKYKSNYIQYSQIIGPSVFLWKKNKADFINKEMNRIFSIFQIDRKYYKSSKYSYIGHPLLNKVIERKNIKSINNIGFFLGSRSQEVLANFKIIKDLISKIQDFGNFNFYIFSTSEFINFTKNNFKNKKITHLINDNRYYSNISKLDFAFACSGTVHLELCFSKVPHFIFYKANILNYFIFKFFVKTKYLSLINIFNKKEIIKEFIQKNFNSSDLFYSFKLFFDNPNKFINYRKNIIYYSKNSNLKKLDRTPIIDYLKKFS